MNVIVTGYNLSPDCSGEYYYDGCIEGQDTYQSFNHKFCLYWNIKEERWILQSYETGSIWTRYDIDILGDYDPDINDPSPIPDGFPNVDEESSSSSSSEESSTDI